MCAGPLLIWRKGPQTWSDTRAEMFLQTAADVFSIPVSHPTCWGQKLLLWGTALLQSWLLSGSGWCWAPPGAQGWEGSWSSPFPLLQAEQHLQCLPRTATAWVGALTPLQSLPTLASSAVSMGQPSFPWSPAAFQPLCPPRHLNFCVC